MTIQIEILKFLEQMRTEPLTLLFTTITMMAESLFIVSIIAILYWCIDKVKSKHLAWMVLVSFVGNGFIKNIIRMPRPFELGEVKPIRTHTATGYSFPSGHTQTATSFWTGAMMILKTRGIKVLGAFLIIMTAFSRIYLGVHWPMDVAGGIIFGVLFTLIANGLLGDTSEIKSAHVIGVSVVLLLTMIFKVDEDLYKGAAALWGLTLGCYIEQKYINFETKGALKTQVKKVVVGVTGLVIIYLGISGLFPAVKIIRIIKYTLVLLWLAAGAPYLFKKVKWIYK